MLYGEDEQKLQQQQQGQWWEQQQARWWVQQQQLQQLQQDEEDMAHDMPGVSVENVADAVLEPLVSAVDGSEGAQASAVRYSSTGGADQDAVRQEDLSAFLRDALIKDEPRCEEVGTGSGGTLDYSGCARME